MLFFSTTLASSIIISPEFSLVSFHYGIEKNLSYFGLPHALPFPRVVYMLPANNPLCPKQIQQVHCQDLSQEFWSCLSNFTIDSAFSEYDYFIF